MTVSVQSQTGSPYPGLPVYVFSGEAYTGFNAISDANGQVEFTLPAGDYRFRSDYDGVQFWSEEVNHCTIPGCDTATVVVMLPVTVTVQDTNAVLKEGVSVYAFDGSIYTGNTGISDSSGEAVLTLPPGDYHFRADLNGTQFWSNIQNDCTIPGCETASITATIPLSVTVQSQTGAPYPDLPIYVFSGENYPGHNDISDVNGQVIFTLPAGDYRFRSDYDGVQFWSDDVDHCTVPGCLEATVEIPGGTGEVNVTINYYYDPLYRLTEADYSTGEYFWYTYDAVGNRMTQETQEDINTYVYDDANKLIDVDGVTFTWDVNGNLLADGVSTFTYNWADRLESVLQGDDEYEFVYNGLGDRLSQSVNGEWTDYALDLATGLTQVLDDGTNWYLYGIGRIGEEQDVGGWQYHQGDALGSVRQLTDSDRGVSQAESYQPFGELLPGSGATTSSYGFTGEWTDLTGLVNLRARYYAPLQGRFIGPDLAEGNPHSPMSYNMWNYVLANPVNYSDPSGMCLDEDLDGRCDYPYIEENRAKVSATKQTERSIPKDFGVCLYCDMCIDDELADEMSLIKNYQLQSQYIRIHCPSCTDTTAIDLTVASHSTKAIAFLQHWEKVPLDGLHRQWGWAKQPTTIDDGSLEGGVCVIGYSHEIRLPNRDSCERLKRKNPNAPVWKWRLPTEQDAVKLMEDSHLHPIGEVLRSKINVPITQSMYDALSVWTYNVGIHRLESRLLPVVIKGRYEEMKEAMNWPLTAGGQPSKGLEQRRADEIRYFYHGYPYNE